MIRVLLPAHLQTLAGAGREIQVEVEASASPNSLLDSLEAQYPMLVGTIRDHMTKERRPFLRYFVCKEDISLDSPDKQLPKSVISGEEVFLIIGAIAGG